MNKFLKIVSTMFAAGAMLLTCGSCVKLTKLQDAVGETDVPPKLVFLGDSIAAGYGLDGYSPDDLYNCSSYANILGRRYGTALDGKCEQVTVNDAVTGDTSSQLLAHIRDGEFDSALADSDAVVISIGGNDLLDVLWKIAAELGYDQIEHKFDASDIDIVQAILSIAKFDDNVDETLELFESNLLDIIAALRERTDAEVFVQTLYDPFSYLDDIKFITDITGEKVDKFNSIVGKNADRGGVHFYTVVDVAEKFSGKCGELTNIRNYDIHPNETGHAVIADVVDTALHAQKYTYIYQEEVTDTDAVIAMIWVCALSAAAVIGAAVLTVVLVKRRKKNNA